MSPPLTPGPVTLGTSATARAPGVMELVARARRQGVLAGAAVAQCGPAGVLRAWKRAAGEGGWAGPEWAAFGEDETVALVQSLRVDPILRQSGVGRRLMLQLLADLASLGARRVWLYASPLDASTDPERLVRFYGSLGFVPMPPPPGGRAPSGAPALERALAPLAAGAGGAGRPLDREPRAG